MDAHEDATVVPERAETEWTQADAAKARGWQTALQGLGIDVAVAVGLVIAQVLPGIESWEDVRVGWSVWALLVAKTAVQAVVAWLLRRYRDGAGFEPVEPERAADTLPEDYVGA